MADSLFDILTDAIEDAIGDSEPTLFPLANQNGQVAQDLADLRQAANGVDSASDLGAWLAAVDTWRTRVEQLADDAFGGTNAIDALFARFLQSKFPRFAAILALAGVIVVDQNGVATVDWQKLEDFLKDPGNLVNEQMWQALLDDVGAGTGPAPGTAHLIALIAALVIMAPRTISALKQGTLKVGGLPPAATRATTGVWRDFRQTSAQWLSLTFPIADPVKPAAQRTPQSKFDIVSDITPDLSATLAFRSNRRTVSNKTVSGFELWAALGLDDDKWDIPLGDNWLVRIAPGIGFGFGYDGDWHGAFRPVVTGSAELPGPGDPVVVSLGREVPGGAPDIELGPPYDTHLVIQDLGAFLKVRENHPIFEIGGFVHGLSFVLAPRWFRTFGENSIPSVDGLFFALDFDLAYVEGKGVQLNLASGLEFTWHIDKKLGNDTINLTLHSINFKLPIEAGGDPVFKIRLEARTVISATLGPVLIVVNGAGAWVGLWHTADGNFHWGLLPPTGAGLQVTAGPVTGGGFFNYESGPPERYSGALALKITGLFDVSAFGIYEKTAAGNVSLVILLGIRFTPGIQLGYGIMITGFGGLVGINRRADTDALRMRLVSGTAGHLLFPDDPIKNAPAILADLGAFLPAADGVFVVGPTIMLNWLKVGGFDFVSVSLGIFIELPGPTKIILVGVLRASISSGSGKPEDTVLQLRLDIIGVLDFKKKTLEFDATLIESQLLQIFVITGDAAFRASWGEQPYLMLTLGGFHPDFNPAPVQFPDMERIALTYGSKDNPHLWLRFEAYFAITTNSLQFGGRAEIGIKAGPLNAIGFMSLDVLIQFTPFHFTARIEAGVAVRWRNHSIASVKLRGEITGPGPIVLSGKISFEILFFEISWHDSFTLGEDAATPASTTTSVPQELKQELTTTSNLSAVEAQDREVAQRQVASDTFAVVSPLGRLAWSQRRAPLDTLLERFEGAPLPRAQSVRLQVTGATDSVREWFSPGSYSNLSQSEALNRASFDRLPSGVAFGFGTSQSGTTTHTVEMVTFRLPQPAPTPSKTPITIPKIVLESILGRTHATAVADRAAKVTVARERWSVADKDGAPLGAGLTETEAHQRAKQKDGVAVPEADLVDIGAV